jgi:hypothetical protein
MSNSFGAERTKLINDYVMTCQKATKLGFSLFDFYSVQEFSKLSLGAMYSELKRLEHDMLLND